MDDWGEEEIYDDADEIVNEDLDDEYPDDFRKPRDEESESEIEEETDDETKDETETNEDAQTERETEDGFAEGESVEDEMYPDEDVVVPAEGKTSYTDSQSVSVRIVKPDSRKTSEFLQRTELAAVLAVRAKQITSGSQVFVDIGDEQDAIEIAKKELFAYRNPLVIRRYVGKDPDGTLVYENWAVRELGIFPVAEIRNPIGT